MKFQYILLIIVFLTYVQAQNCIISKFITNLANLFSFTLLNYHFFIQNFTAIGLVQSMTTILVFNVILMVIVMELIAPMFAMSKHLLIAVTNFAENMAAKVNRFLNIDVVIIISSTPSRLYQSVLKKNKKYSVFLLVMHVQRLATV